MIVVCNKCVGPFGVGTLMTEALSHKAKELVTNKWICINAISVHSYCGPALSLFFLECQRRWEHHNTTSLRYVCMC